VEGKTRAHVVSAMFKKKPSASRGEGRGAREWIGGLRRFAREATEGKEGKGGGEKGWICDEVHL